MSRKKFWHWLGLPCFDDIQALTAAALRQNEILTSLKTQAEETQKSLADIQAELTVSAQQIEKSSHEVIESSTKEICSLERNIQEKIEKTLAECKSQNELLRLLIANTLIEDFSNFMDMEDIQKAFKDFQNLCKEAIAECEDFQNLCREYGLDDELSQE